MPPTDVDDISRIHTLETLARKSLSTPYSRSPVVKASLPKSTRRHSKSKGSKALSLVRRTYLLKGRAGDNGSRSKRTPVINGKVVSNAIPLSSRSEEEMDGIPMFPGDNTNRPHRVPLGSENPRHSSPRRNSESPDENSSDGILALPSPVIAKEDVVIAEGFADSMAKALDTFGLTVPARKLLESGLAGTVEIDTARIVGELQRLVESPLAGIMEANRLGTVGKLYSTAHEVIDQLLEDMREDAISPGNKIKLLDMVLHRIRGMSGDVAAPGSGRPRGMSQPGMMEFSETRTVKVDLSGRAGRKRVDAVLGETDRPPDNFLDED